MDDYNDRLNLRQRQAIDDRARRYQPQHASDGVFYLVMALFMALVILAGAYLVFGCAAQDNNLLKVLFPAKADKPPTKEEWAVKEEHTQQFARDAAQDSAKTLDRMDKAIWWGEQISFWVAVGAPTLAGVVASLKVHKTLKKKKVTVSE